MKTSAEYLFLFSCEFEDGGEWYRLDVDLGVTERTNAMINTSWVTGENIFHYGVACRVCCHPIQRLIKRILG